MCKAIKRVRCFFVAVGLGMLLTVSAGGQQLAPLPVDAALDTKTFGQYSPVQFSPDSKWLVYVIQDNRKSSTAEIQQYARTGVPLNAIGADIFVVGVAKGDAKSVTGGKGNNWAPAWSPDGRYLAFFSDRDASQQANLWIWEVATDKVWKASDVNIRGDVIQWMPNSREVLVTALPENLTPAEYAEHVLRTGNQKSEEARPFGSTVMVYRSSPISQAKGAEKQSDPWSLEGYLRDLTLVDVSSGKVRRIERSKRIAKYSISPDGSHIAYTAPQRFEKPGSQQILFDLTVVLSSNGQTRIVVSNIRLGYDGAAFSWSPDGARLAYQTGGTEANGDCYVIDVSGENLRNITAFSSQQVSRGWPPLWDESGLRIYFIREGALWQAFLGQHIAAELTRISNRQMICLIPQRDVLLWSPDGGRSTVVVTHDDQAKQSGFFKVDLTNGQATKLLERGQCYTCINGVQFVAVAPGGCQLAYFAEDAQHDRDLWLSDCDFRFPRRLTHVNPQFDKYHMGPPRLIEWRSLDGQPTSGALLLPSGYESGKRYPLITYVYGGSLLSNHFSTFGFGNGGVDNMQLFATRGYAVLLPDAPLHLGSSMFDLVKTVLPGIDKAIEMGIANPDRLGIMGHSYGGYSVLSLIVQTQRFKAAVAADGYGDLIAAYGQMSKDGSAFHTSIAEQGPASMGGTPWQFRDRYIENSPVFFLDRSETPLLLVHGDEDTTVAPFLSDEVFVDLRRLDREVEYAKYRGEGHSLLYWSHANQHDYCNRVITWFDKYLADARK